MNRNALITLSVVAASLMIGQAQGAEGFVKRNGRWQAIATHATRVVKP